jgi:vitamin B12 transporter
MRNPVILLTAILSTTFLQATIAKTMEETVVIGTRTPQTIDKELAPVTLITKEQIQKLQIHDMAQLLRQVPGWSIKTSGSYGSQLGVFLRGTNSSQTLVLRNGERMNSATSGGADLSYIDPDQIERIEVVRGARTSLYGADAIGGVINIITQDDTAPNHAMIKAGYGTYNTQRYAAAARYNLTGSTKMQVNYMKHQTDGFSSQAKTNQFDKDDDAFDNTGLQASLTQELGSSGKWTLGYFHDQGKNDYDMGNINPHDAYNKRFIDNLFTNYQYELTEQWVTTLNLAQVKDEKRDLYRDQADYLNVFKTNRTSALWQNDVNWNMNQTSTLGFEYRKENIDGSIPPIGNEYVDQNGNPVDSRNNHALFFQHLINYDFFELQATVRNDSNNAYGDRTTGNVSFGIPLDAGTLVLSYGTAFRAPTFNDLYYKSDKFIPNPNLSPETSRQFEISFKGFQEYLHYEVSAYLNKMEDMIASPKVGDQYIAMNINTAEIQGFDFIVGYQWDSLWLNVSYSYVDAEDRTTHEQLTFRPKNILTLDLIQSFEKISFGMTLLAQSRSLDYNRNTMPGFATVDVFSAYKIARGLTAKLKFANLFDQDYVVNSGYNTAGITGFFSLTYDYAL